MKKVAYFTLLMFSLILISCDPTEKTEPIDDPTEGMVEVDLVDLYGIKMIRLWNGTSCSFEAIKDGEYSIKSEDTSVATVKVEGKVFTVMAGRPGDTNIIINDKDGNETIIRCFSCAFDEHWIEHPLLNQHYQNSINVATSDKSVADLIKAELKAIGADNRDFQVYVFTQETNELITGLQPQTAVRGTYNWDFDTRTLTLSYEGITEKYRCDIMPQYPNIPIGNGQNPRFIVAITKDYTEEYKQKYPDAGIEEVFVIRHMISRSDFWHTERKKR